MKPRLLILSDLWGVSNSDWLKHYTENLKDDFDINYYDCRELAGINAEGLEESELHQAFVNGGIDKAVNELIEQEKDAADILAFSVGGVIAWKFGLANHKLNSITAISSTRLRKETSKPACSIDLYFGEQDEYRPKTNWHNTMEIKEQIFLNCEHDCYRNVTIANQICAKLKA